MIYDLYTVVKTVTASFSASMNLKWHPTGLRRDLEAKMLNRARDVTKLVIFVLFCVYYASDNCNVGQS